MLQEINREAGARILDTFKPTDLRELIMRAADRQMHRPESVSHRRYLKGVNPFRVLSLGAGTQSTVLALMADDGMGAGWKSQTSPYLPTPSGSRPTCTNT